MKKRIIFVDWYDVITKSDAWRYIQKNHPLYDFTQTLMNKLIIGSHPDEKDWMRGCKSTVEIVAKHCPGATSTSGMDIIALEKEQYMNQLDHNIVLFDALRCFKSQGHLIVLATDNVDYFSELISDFAEYDVFDYVINSADVKALKAEDPEKFFGSFITSQNMSFSDAILIDDKAYNIDAFTSVGGQGLCYKYPQDNVKQAMHELSLLLT